MTAEVERIESLIESNRLLQAMLDGLDEIIVFTLDTQYRYTGFNEPHRREMKTAWNAEITIGSCLLDWMSNPELRTEAEASLARVLRGESFEEIKHQPGIDVYYEFRWSPVRSPSGEIGGIKAVIRNITSRQRTNIALADSEANFRAVFENASIGMSLTAPDGRLKQINRAFAAMLGYSIEEIQNLSFAAITHPDDIAESRESIRCLLANERATYRMEKRYRHKAGHYVWADVSTTLFRDASGRPIHLITNIMDISDRKHAEDALREARDLLEQRVEERTLALQRAMAYNRNLFEAGIDPLVTIGPDGAITDANKAMETITGRSRPELVGTDFSDYFTDPEKARAGYRRVFDQGFVRDYDLRIRHRDGSAKQVHYNASVYCDDAGGVAGVIAAARDMTEAKRIEADLIRNKKLLDDMASLARVGGWEIDLRANTLTWTDMVYEIHEIGRDFIPTVETGIRFYAPEAVPVISEGLRLAVAEGLPFDLELQLITAKNRRLWVRAIGGAVRENGEIVRVGGTFQDINERKLAELELAKYRDHLEDLVAARTADLARSNKELELFAYVASHDLQEPLRMVSSYTQLLAKRYEGQLDAKAKKYIDYAVDGSVRMQRLINDLLAYSRISTRGQSPTPIDAHEVLDEALGNLNASIAESGGLVTNDDLPTVRVDRSQLLQVFQNLIANALKFRGEEPPRIHISAREQADAWLFSVRDNGIGIDPQYADKLFVIFRRLHTREEYPGTGIGLAICKRIVERHGGRIWFESELGQGTTFFFTISK